MKPTITQQTLNLTNRFQTMQLEIQRLQQRNSQLERLLEQKNDENKQLRGEIEDTQMLVQQATNINNKLSSDLQQARQTVDSTQSIQGRLLQAQQQILTYKAQLDAQFAIQLQHQQQKMKMEAQVEDLRRQLHACESLEGQYKRQLEALGEQVQEQQNHINVLDRCNQQFRMQQGLPPDYELEKNNVKYKQENDKLRQQLKLYQDHITELQAQLVKLGTITGSEKDAVQIRQLQQENEELSSHIQRQQELQHVNMQLTAQLAEYKMKNKALSDQLSQAQRNYSQEMLDKNVIVQHLVQSQQTQNDLIHILARSHNGASTLIQEKKVQFADVQQDKGPQVSLNPSTNLVQKSPLSVNSTQYSEFDLQSDYFQRSRTCPLPSENFDKMIADTQQSKNDGTANMAQSENMEMTKIILPNEENAERYIEDQWKDIDFEV